METLRINDVSAASNDSYELADVGQNAGLQNTELDDSSTSGRVYEDGPNVQELAPIDGGRQAWTFCASAFVLETLVWGFGST